MVIMEYKPYVPRDISELLDYLAHMRLASPTFEDKTGYLRRMNLDTTFISLNEGLLILRKKLGEERCATLLALSDKMRMLFESDPGDNTGDARTGRKLIREMEDILRSVIGRSPQK
jgi:hypothetical protein